MPDALSNPISGAFVSQRLRQHYVEWPNPGKPPLLLVHGGRDHCRNWDWVAEHLLAKFHIVAPDLRGHGDSDWSPSGDYSLAAHIYDLAQLIEHKQLAPLTIIGHSLGASLALRYAGIFPENVVKLIAIEGLGLPRQAADMSLETPYAQKMRKWIDGQRKLALRSPRAYNSLEDAIARMQAENKHLRPDQIAHLTLHGVRKNDDGTFAWKFDNYMRSRIPVDATPDELNRLWAAIECPVLLLQGRNSFVPDQTGSDGVGSFRNARLSIIENAGHWLHHDQLSAFLAEVDTFLDG